MSYMSYRFKDKDPIIDFLRTAVNDSGQDYKHIADGTGMSLSTLYAWFHGNTRRPQYASVMAVLMYLGYSVEYVRKRGIVVPMRRKRA